jgi:ribosomal protein S18 acetylase RimI-like enzyme
MENEEFEKYKEIYLEEYIADISKYEEEFTKQIGIKPREFAEKQFKDSLPDGMNTPHNFFWMAVKETNGQEIGFFWFSIVPDKMLSVLSRIHIHENHRGLEYETKILHFWEDYLSNTYPEITILYLHVFKHKSKHLYEEFGFTLYYESFEGDNLIKKIKQE